MEYTERISSGRSARRGEKFIPRIGRLFFPLVFRTADRYGKIVQLLELLKGCGKWKLHSEQCGLDKRYVWVEGMPL